MMKRTPQVFPPFEQESVVGPEAGSCSSSFAQDSLTYLMTT